MKLGHENDCGFIALLELQAIVQCTDIHPISREAVEGILNHEYVVDDYQVKCWLSCVLNQLVVIKDGNMDWEYFKHLIKHCLNEEDDKAKVDELIRICKAEVPQEKDACELAYTSILCKINAWKELGLP
ncbi:uncharacterized protein [Halyomorpha halys]|uniref:uncharacterized protein isoform X3 n=1 Tax=Halyomorpha halys TaxID=286706 RepID=UPI0006D506BE|nr:uncharacterized protein LOC106678078 isoform X3 [Halyomorpha halys]KAE8572980.1 Odorant-binding protein 31 isoform X1 [Halyomorpha halys]